MVISLESPDTLDYFGKSNRRIKELANSKIIDSLFSKPRTFIGLAIFNSYLLRT